MATLFRETEKRIAWRIMNYFAIAFKRRCLFKNNEVTVEDTRYLMRNYLTVKRWLK